MTESNIIVFPTRPKPITPAEAQAALLAQISRVLDTMKEIHADLDALRKTLKPEHGP